MEEIGKVDDLGVYPNITRAGNIGVFHVKINIDWPFLRLF
jgi:hypothetical protein